MLEQRFELVDRFELVQIELQFAALHLREVKQGFDVGHHVFGGAVDHVDVIALGGAGMRRLEQIQESHDPVHRRPELMRNVAEELAFGAVGLFAFFFGLRLFGHIRHLEERKAVHAAFDDLAAQRESRLSPVGQRHADDGGGAAFRF